MEELLRLLAQNQPSNGETAGDLGLNADWSGIDEQEGAMGKLLQNPEWIKVIEQFLQQQGGAGPAPMKEGAHSLLNRLIELGEKGVPGKKAIPGKEALPMRPPPNIFQGPPPPPQPPLNPYEIGGPNPDIGTPEIYPYEQGGQYPEGPQLYPDGGGPSTDDPIIGRDAYRLDQLLKNIPEIEKIAPRDVFRQPDIRPKVGEYLNLEESRIEDNLTSQYTLPYGSSHRSIKIQ